MNRITIKETIEGVDTSPLARRYRTDGNNINVAFASSYLDAKGLKGRSPALIREIEYRRELKRNLASYEEYEI